jgi:pentatricopeptide repeat protein
MVSDYMDAGNVEKAFSSPTRNLVSWNVVSAGYVKNSTSEDALRVFKTVVRDANVQPNESTLNSVLLGCSSLYALDSGDSRWCMKLPSGRRVTVCTSLVIMYCKCGDLEGACKLFSELHN